MAAKGPQMAQMGTKRHPKWRQKEERDPKRQAMRNRNAKVTKRVRRSMQIEGKRVRK